jgi:peptide/nickel transport system permease protein
MTSYYAERIGQAILTVFAVVTLTFGMIRLMPGGPVDYIRAQMIQEAGGSIDYERINRQVELYTNVAPDKPLLHQYVDYVGSLLQGNLGQSIQQNKPVAEILGSALPWTVYIMSVSLVLTFGIGITLGAAMAYAEGSRFDSISSLFSILLNSIPYYIAAIVLIYFLGSQWAVLPTQGRVKAGLESGTLAWYLSVVKHSIMPIASYVATAFGVQALAMRGNSIRVIGEDYLRVARLRGLSRRVIALRYIGRNAVLPMYTTMMIAIGFMFGGAVILEEIFTYPGIGYYMFQAINTRDYPLMMGAFLIITLAVVVGVLFADLTYGKIDPRAERGGEDV